MTECVSWLSLLQGWGFGLFWVGIVLAIGIADFLRGVSQRLRR